MTITFFSNYLNHHQSPFCERMHTYLKDDFTFVSTKKTPDERIKKGYPDCSNYVYNLRSYESKTEFEKAIKLGMTSDVVIIGSAPDIFIKERLIQNKLTFRYCERFFKKGMHQLLDHKLMSYLIHTHTLNRKKNVHVLCASAYAANDLRWLLAYPGKKFKWGYFTTVEKLKISQILFQKSTRRIEILWVSRFIPLKHPETVLDLAFELKRRGYDFHLTMIGSGPMVESFQKSIAENSLLNHITITGNIPNAEVRDYMKRAHIFIFTSDQNEGWGAVLNEAMSCGCAVIASNAIGAVPYLIDHQKNGLIYKYRRFTELLEHTERLITDKGYREELSTKAYLTMANTWNPEIAAERFLQLAKSIMDGQQIKFENGPCSQAGIIKRNFWK